MFTSALLMALRPHLGEFAPDKLVDFNMRGGENGDEVGILVRALVPDVDALKNLLKAINSRTLGFRRLERDDGIELTGVGVGEPFGPDGLPLVKIRARKGQAYLEMEIL